MARLPRHLRLRTGPRRDGLRDLDEHSDRDRNRPEGEDAVRIDRRRLVRRDALAGDVRAARRALVDHLHPIEHDDRVRAADRRVREDERGARGFAPDDDLAARSLDGPRGHEHQRDRGVRERDGRLPDRELGAEIEGHRLVRRDRRAVRGARSGAEVDEDERAPLFDDPRVVRRDAGPLEDDVAVRSAAERDELFSEAGDHG